jgi:hypothetical protein
MSLDGPLWATRFSATALTTFIPVGEANLLRHLAVRPAMGIRVVPQGSSLRDNPDLPLHKSILPRTSARARLVADLQQLSLGGEAEPFVGALAAACVPVTDPGGDAAV